MSAALTNPFAAPRKSGITAELRDHRWHDSSADDASPEVRIQMCGDRRIIMWADAEGVNVGALEGERAVWDYVPGGTLAEAEQTAFDCYGALMLLSHVRVVPTEAKGGKRRLRRRAVRAFARLMMRWMLVLLGCLAGAALCAVTAVLGFLAGWMVFP